MFLRNCSVLLLCLLTGFSISACGPRGETNTLDQIIESARKRYAVALPAAPEALREELASVLVGLEALEETARNSMDGQRVRVDPERFSQMSQLLAELSTKAGITSRPAFGALMGQYENFKTQATGGQAPQATSLILLVARTYNLLGSELESASFAT